MKNTIIGYSLDHFGGNVVGRPAVAAELLVPGVHHPRVAEVNEADRVVTLHHNVFELDVPVHDVQSVDAGQGLGDVQRDAPFFEDLSIKFMRSWKGLPSTPGVFSKSFRDCACPRRRESGGSRPLA